MTYVVLNPATLTTARVFSLNNLAAFQHIFTGAPQPSEERAEVAGPALVKEVRW